MSRKYFGTDGVRGRVGQYPITPDFVLRLGYAAGQVLANRNASGSHRPGVLIGKDTRNSGYMLEAALEAGFSAAGVDVFLTGPLPTPGIAYLTRALRLQAGVVISASHNPFHDNGIKFFSADGKKLPDDVERAIESAIDAMEGRPMQTVEPKDLGRARRIDDAAGRYIEFCKSTVPASFDLRGLKIVVDCAHGAAYHIAAEVLHELGAEVVAIGNMPDGVNINEGVGALHPELLASTIEATGADFGIALDGDADRLVIVDAAGHAYDGDQILYAIVQERLLDGPVAGVVGTLMTNMALEQALKARGVPFKRAKVGDRYVMEMLAAEGWLYGGENSGHILALDRHTTGDGLVSALQVLVALKRAGGNMAELLGGLVLFPQCMINVPVKAGFNWQDHVGVVAAVKASEGRLGAKGRVLLRPSGTEPVLRVMVEAEARDLSQTEAESIVAAVRAAL
ncbi:MAG: phosphoglucosamine mutase [Rhodocyclales bacterium]|nr:phosphoglucosamine mutase [Rhodocyclales bacterium]